MREKIGGLPKSLLAQMDRDLRIEIEKGAIRPMTALDLMLTILSLNLVLFLAGPALQVLTGITEPEYQNLVESRKRENMTIILKSLRP